MDEPTAIRQAVKAHYEKYVYPRIPLLASVERCDTYALNLESLWARFNGERLAPEDGRILLAGCGSFSPYPTAVANGSARITALDLSKANLNRARLHTLLHLRLNLAFVEGDLLDAKAILGENRFHFIDCYGVLHHVPDVVPALQSIHSLLREGGISRIMVYSTGARRSIQAVRTAMRLLHVDEVKTIKRLYRQATGGSRFKDCIESNCEAGFDWGLADMFLHPYAKTYKIDELLDILDAARLEPILFVHPGAFSEPAEEIERLRKLETANELVTNFILFAGRIADSEVRLAWNRCRQTRDTFISLNPVIQNSLSPLPFRTLKPGPKLGFENPPIDFRANRLLAKFKRPVRKSTVEPGVWDAIQPFLHAMFLIETAI
jgi:2-polyprenyl-3-methyl-5-hydroxy-6-metoxy-1,4-benzoquinol methylase